MDGQATAQTGASQRLISYPTAGHGGPTGPLARWSKKAVLRMPSAGDLPFLDRSTHPLDHKAEGGRAGCGDGGTQRWGDGGMGAIRPHPDHGYMVPALSRVRARGAARWGGRAGADARISSG